MADQLASRLRARLLRDEFRPGDKLPTEQALCRQYGVSRTVVREALATLRANGLVIARRGSGVFAARRSELPQRFSLFLQPTDRLSSLIDMLELRAAVESEAAALAATRCSPSELARIQECYRDISAALERGELAEDQDFQFHLAIARATHNRHFVEFFEFLGKRTIPRSQLRSELQSRSEPAAKDAVTGSESSAYLECIQEEHRRIVEAIASRDKVRAHSSMQTHLRGSQERYRRLMEQTGEK